ncbi:hypothetical protein BH23ACT5_BH23ACT5_20690 [soil metagenome]
MTIQGVVQTYDPITGTGVVVRDDDRTEVYLRPGSLAGSIFRNLRQGQRIVFDLVTEDDCSYASTVRIGQEAY